MYRDHFNNKCEKFINRKEKETYKIGQTKNEINDGAYPEVIKNIKQVELVNTKQF